MNLPNSGSQHDCARLKITVVNAPADFTREILMRREAAELVAAHTSPQIPVFAWKLVFHHRQQIWSIAFHEAHLIHFQGNVGQIPKAEEPVRHSFK